MVEGTSEEIKVVITLKGGRGTIGVQAPGCDPLFATLEGGLAEVLGRVPALMGEARQRWAQSPHYPKCESPLPAPTPPTPPPPGRPARAPRQQETASPSATKPPVPPQPTTATVKGLVAKVLSSRYI